MSDFSRESLDEEMIAFWNKVQDRRAATAFHEASFRMERERPKITTESIVLEQVPEARESVNPIEADIVTKVDE